MACGAAAAPTCNAAGIDYETDGTYLSHGAVLRFDGTAWSEELETPGIAQLYGVWTSGPDDVFAVGQDPRIVHFDGSSWTYQETNCPPSSDGGSCSFSGIWGSGSRTAGPRDVWAVGQEPGNHGIIYHYDGTSWSESATIASYGLNRVWGSAPDDVFVVGAPALGTAAVIMHYDGERWGEMLSPTDHILWDVHGTGPDNVWAVGGNTYERVGVLLHYDGSSWKVDRFTDVALEGVWVPTVDEVYIFGTQLDEGGRAGNARRVLGREVAVR